MRRGEGGMCARAALGALALLAAALAGAGCGVAELACRAGAVRCVRLDAWCDGAAQCADGSDEPAGCTVCNRTYYGRAGVAYSLALREAPRVPFLCHLTFTAGGGAHGDLVQLAFEEFHVGRHEAGALDGCPDGYMQLAELGRPFTGGSWCGAADAAALYYSETATVTVSVKLFRARLGEPFAFRLRYKFLAQRDAIVRFGAAEAPLERGAVSPGTYCTRTYEECHRKRCRLQSPNYPGMYPRNVTCYWILRQKDIPTCKHAMISVRQDYSHKMQIKRSISASMNKTGRVMRAWRECTGERDRLIVYDGGSTDDPVLVEYCGGDWLPRVTSRGPEMLVAFHSSPYSAPLRPAARAQPLRGFELDVDVIFADSDSLDYVREARRCEFHVKASSSEEEGNVTSAGAGRGRRGLLRAPQHTLPPRTTCTWTFHGRPGDLVWVYFSSFTHYSLMEPRRSDSGERSEDAGGEPLALARPPPPPPSAAPRACAVQLRIWDGGGAGAPLVGEYCDTAPVLCARASLANATRVPRPCAPPDGYVSSSALLSLAATSLAGTATHPLQFALHYEFVDARLEGAALAGAAGAAPAQCARLLVSPGEFSSPRNALWFGRGGARRLRCVYRLQAAAGRVLLRLAAARPRRLLPRAARARARWPGPVAAARARPRRRRRGVASPAHLDLRLPVARLQGAAGVHLRQRVGAAGGGGVGRRVRAGVVGADAGGTRGPPPRALPRRLEQCAGAGRLRRAAPPAAARGTPAPSVPLRERAAVGVRRGAVPAGGARQPLRVPARVGRRGAGRRGRPARLPHRQPRAGLRRAHLTVGIRRAAAVWPNRSAMQRVRLRRLVKAICPSRDGEHSRTVHVFTEEWSGGGGGGAGAALLVVWLGRAAGAARLSWMEVWRGAAHNGTAGCRHACAALGGCMAPALWCDGAEDCPGGADEARGCGAGARLLRLLGGAGALGVIPRSIARAESAACDDVSVTLNQPARGRSRPVGRTRSRRWQSILALARRQQPPLHSYHHIPYTVSPSLHSPAFEVTDISTRP
ncbi:uncharacterized protein LOC126372641 [Pectinophora gossypiella]|uniref:uncharacterized protein LOC126372641 n=1 Tax=Pectinophora gossypiella TaxID=13191 RepID=UPI00214F3F6A|nr:uncharacterized protein LOC126372641 [Pectinophora gossypiella]